MAYTSLEIGLLAITVAALMGIIARLGMKNILDAFCGIVWVPTMVLGGSIILLSFTFFIIDALPLASKSYHMYTQQEMKDNFLQKIREQPIARKTAQVWARPAQEGEVVITVTSDGVETVNTANEGDMVVTNATQAGEKYIIRKEEFPNLYDQVKPAQHIFNDPQEQITLYQSKNRVHALRVSPLTCPGDFMAPWGSPTKCVPGDYLVCPVGADKVYRIAKKEFNETYKFEEEQ